MALMATSHPESPPPAQNAIGDKQAEPEPKSRARGDDEPEKGFRMRFIQTSSHLTILVGG
jgi:hypothetical protein